MDKLQELHEAVALANSHVERAKLLAAELGEECNADYVGHVCVLTHGAHEEDGRRKHDREWAINTKYIKDPVLIMMQAVAEDKILKALGARAMAMGIPTSQIISNLMHELVIFAETAHEDKIHPDEQDIFAPSSDHDGDISDIDQAALAESVNDLLEEDEMSDLAELFNFDPQELEDEDE